MDLYFRTEKNVCMCNFALSFLFLLEYLSYVICSVLLLILCQ